jgi:hypothetical protein
MSEYEERYERLGLAKLLYEQPGLRVAPTASEELVLRGDVSFEATGPDGTVIVDHYSVELIVPADLSRTLPTARETGGRIPDDFHKLSGGHLCLGAPTELRLRLTLEPTLDEFVNRIVIPYLYGHSYFERHGRMPFGELPHGKVGIRYYLCGLFRAPGSARPEEFVRLASMKRRQANKRPCPCASGKRLGKCHNRAVNRFRDKYGRRWCGREYHYVLRSLS